jgi:hypothetical protein
MKSKGLGVLGRPVKPGDDKLIEPRRAQNQTEANAVTRPHTGRSPFTVTRVPARVCGQ